jgi:hypothetical protein
VAPSRLATIRNAVLVASAKTIAKYGPGIVHGPDSLLVYRLIIYFVVTMLGCLVRLVLGQPKPPAPAAPALRQRAGRKTLRTARARTAGRSPKRKKPNDTR